MTTSILVLTGVIFLALTAVTIAVIPIIKLFKDFFVNGVKYAKELKLFIGTPGKVDITEVLEAYYGRMKTTTLSWNRIHGMVSEMFSHDTGSKDYTNTLSIVHFYGNDGVCLFKYFVDNNDPQKMFVWGILAVNFVCFLFISTSYLLIALITSRSSKNVTSNSKGDKKASKRTKRMNQRIAFIIFTDFICWIPFILICILHSVEILDATPWYGVFSMLILPINSVINPLIYDDTIVKLVRDPVRKFLAVVSNSAIIQNMHDSVSLERQEKIELENVNQQEKNRSVSGENKFTDHDIVKEIGLGAFEENDIIIIKQKRLEVSEIANDEIAIDGCQ